MYIINLGIMMSLWPAMLSANELNIFKLVLHEYFDVYVLRIKVYL